ncbi:MAG: RNA methyltransferase [Parcubacteria group bacterium]
MKAMGKTARKNNAEVAVICHNIRSAYNIGSIFRTADGAGVKKIFLTGYSPTPPHSGIIKSALGAELTVKWEKALKITPLIVRLKKDGYEVVAIEQNERSEPLDQFRLRRKTCLVLGNEVRGLSKKIFSKCDRILEIPMRGKKESLNVSVAFGIAAYSIIKN